MRRYGSPLDTEFLAFRDALAGLGLECSEDRLEALVWYREAVRSWNRRVNLVSRRDVDRLVEYHFLDCAEGLRCLRTNVDTEIMDLGSGAGFPGLVWKILRPALRMTLVESVRKRCLFLERVVGHLGLRETVVLRVRAEELVKDGGLAGGLDVVVVRTVAKLARLVEMGLPLLRGGGRLVAFKGAGLAREKVEAE
ncbi:MAG: 16S rRNA (guanine(527)-N(7))-methyltransferase RsmG, partial [Candidatus Eisenbacteria sp.]|nr:16S rRNA (guanine(527)-N(7))-methyltransferase RsmG [Candidatus Eisenbacteria bacterium]